MKKIFTPIFFLIVAFAVQAQNKNFVTLSHEDSYHDIIKKAATVVPSARQLRWQQLELTTFFHFGINTFTGKEWGTGKESPAIFKPTQLDAEQWVRAVKDAGFKQVIITAKHHDGFCLWPTKTTAHSVKSSPWKNGNGDLVKEVSDACKKYKLGFGIYLSPWDMNAAVYGTDAYNDFFVRQLTELLTNYGTVDEVWFDGANGEGPNGKKQAYDFSRWYAVIRKLQPSAVIAVMGPDVRWVGTESGYGREQEWSVVPTDNLDQETIKKNSQQSDVFKPAGDMRGSDLGSREKILDAKGLIWYPAETDVSIRPGWFFHAEENNKVKTPEKLLDIYFSSVGRNSVLLLNIPPDKRGLIHDSDLAVLKEWNRRLQHIFENNLAKDAVTRPRRRVNASALFDANSNTSLKTASTDTSATIEFRLKKPVTFNVLLLQEDISKGQRIENFELEALINKQWKKITEGTTIGHKRLLHFDDVNTNRIRLKILSSRLNPFLSEFGIFYNEFKLPSAQNDVHNK